MKTLILSLVLSAGLLMAEDKPQSELEAAKAKISTLEKQLAELTDAPAIAQKWYESSASCQAALVRLQVQIDKIKPEAPSKVKP